MPKTTIFLEKMSETFPKKRVISLESFPNFDQKEAAQSCATGNNLSAWSGLWLHCLVREGRDACAADSIMMILAHFART